MQKASVAALNIKLDPRPRNEPVLFDFAPRYALPRYRQCSDLFRQLDTVTSKLMAANPQTPSRHDGSLRVERVEKACCSSKAWT